VETFGGTPRPCIRKVSKDNLPQPAASSVRGKRNAYCDPISPGGIADVFARQKSARRFVLGNVSFFQLVTDKRQNKLPGRLGLEAKHESPRDAYSDL